MGGIIKCDALWSKTFNGISETNRVRRRDTTVCIVLAELKKRKSRYACGSQKGKNKGKGSLLPTNAWLRIIQAQSERPCASIMRLCCHRTNVLGCATRLVRQSTNQHSNSALPNKQQLAVSAFACGSCGTGCSTVP